MAHGPGEGGGLRWSSAWSNTSLDRLPYLPPLSPSPSPQQDLDKVTVPQTGPGQDDPPLSPQTEPAQGDSTFPPFPFPFPYTSPSPRQDIWQGDPTPPSVDKRTDTFENITSPRTTYVAVNNHSTEPYTYGKNATDIIAFPQIIGKNSNTTLISCEVPNCEYIHASQRLSSGWNVLFSVFIPGPIIMGRVFDSTCLLWRKTCGKEGNCLVYDMDKFR